LGWISPRIIDPTINLLGHIIKCMERLEFSNMASQTLAVFSFGNICAENGRVSYASSGSIS
jgi:hypothetical protein